MSLVWPNDSNIEEVEKKTEGEPGDIFRGHEMPEGGQRKAEEMSKGYDGWVIKIMGDHPLYLMWTFHTTRKRTIRTLEENWYIVYSKWKERNDGLKAVKIRIVEAK